MNDLISRQPKRTEERTETHACDCISRQAVIEAINKIFPADPMRDDYTQGITCGAALANIYVAQLPSAQPETHEERTETHGVCLDTISRQEAIAATRNAKISFTIKSDIDFANYRKEIQEMFNNILDAQEKALKELPSAQPDLSGYSDKLWQKAYERGKAEAQQRWIPCSERLPEDGTWNIFSDGKNISVERYKMDAIDHFFPQGRWFSFDKAIAWMPLQEPYAEKKTDETDKEDAIEPEIVRCKDCKWFHDIGCAIQIVDDSDKPSENDYCSFAERRTYDLQ